MTTQTRRKTRLSCGVVVLRQTAQGTRLLLLRAFRNWDFPKGMRERGETPMAAALREVEEETTLTDLDFLWGEQFIETGPYSRGKVARYYIALTECCDIDLPVNPEIGRAEHAEYRWVDVEQARNLTTARLAPVIDWVTEHLKQV